jgi:hypothetical protein
MATSHTREESKRKPPSEYLIKSVFLQTSVNYDIIYSAALTMLKCHFIVMASNELTSVREVIISAEERP